MHATNFCGGLGLGKYIFVNWQGSRSTVGITVLLKDFVVIKIIEKLGKCALQIKMGFSEALEKKKSVMLLSYFRRKCMCV